MSNLQSKNNNENENEEIDDHIDIMMQQFMVSWISENLDDHGISSNPFALTICITEEDDCPHPRHLCFKYPFGKTSHKKHCKKCYCYVCEEVAPCKRWNRSTKKHCDATASQLWISENKARKKISSLNTTMARHTLSISFMHHPPDQTVLTNGSAGGLISDSAGNWVAGFSEHIYSDLGCLDASVPPYIALIKGLQLAWSRGYRFLDVELGYLYQEGFWLDFKKDGSAGNKYRLRLDDIVMRNRARAWCILRKVEDLINQDWFVNVKNSASIVEESGALALAMMACWVPWMRVYDFPSHELTSMLKYMAEISKEDMGQQFDASFMSGLPGDPFEELRTYTRSRSL